MRLLPGIRLLWLTGVAASGIAAAAALVPSLRPASWWLLGLTFLIVVGDAFFGRQVTRGIRLRVPGVTRSYKGREQQLDLEIQNCGQRERRLRVGLLLAPELGARVEDQPVTLKPGQEWNSLPWIFLPMRRGQFPVKLGAIEAASPLGLWDVQVRFEVDGEVRVYPNLRRAAELAALRRLTGGAKPLRQIGKGREFEKLREYVPGDGYDEIHWKATARRRVPVTKVFQVERTQEVYVVVDGSRLSARELGGETLLDHYLNATLLLAGAAEQRGDLFGLAIFSDQVRTFVRARRGKSHFGACREAVYRAQPLQATANFAEVTAFLQTQLPRRALLLVLSSFEDLLTAERFTSASRLLGKKHLVVGATVRPAAAAPLFSNPEAEDLHAELAGHFQWRGLRELELSLRRQGIRLALLDSGRMYGDLIALYEDIKQRQLI